MKNNKSYVEGNNTPSNQATASEALALQLEEAALPANDTAKSICKKLYTSDINSVEALRQFFSNVNTFRASQHDNPCYALEAVEVLQLLSVNKYKSFTNSDYPIRQDLISTLSSLCARIETTTEAISIKSVFEQKKEELEDSNEVFDIETFLTPVIKHWDILVKYQEIFDILCSICLILNTIYTDNNDSVYKVIALIKALSRNWD